MLDCVIRYSSNRPDVSSFRYGVEGSHRHGAVTAGTMKLLAIDIILFALMIEGPPPDEKRRAAARAGIVMTGTITVNRSFETSIFTGDFVLWIDGKNAGSIASGEIKSISVDAGEHRVQVIAGAFYSDPLLIDVPFGRDVKLAAATMIPATGSLFFLVTGGPWLVLIESATPFDTGRQRIMVNIALPAFCVAVGLLVVALGIAMGEVLLVVVALPGAIGAGHIVGREVTRWMQYRHPERFPAEADLGLVKPPYSM